MHQPLTPSQQKWKKSALKTVFCQGFNESLQIKIARRIEEELIIVILQGIFELILMCS